MNLTVQSNFLKIKARVGCRETDIGLDSCQTSPTLPLVLGTGMKFRKRILSGEFFQNKKLAKLEPHARLLFGGLWLLADREGLLIDNPIVLHGQIFPYEPKLNIDKLLTLLSDSGFIVRYSIDDDDYLWVPAFTEHQNVHPNETQSVIPLPDNVIAGQCNGKGGAIKKGPLVKVKEKVKVKVKVKEEVRKFVEKYHEICISLPKILKIGNSRSGTILLRIADLKKADISIESFLERVEASDWLAGRAEAGDGWTADFDWILKPTKFFPILEGKHDNRGKKSKSQHQETGPTTI